ncbi:MAG: ABC transporter permease [Bacilli bacterium]
MNRNFSLYLKRYGQYLHNLYRTIALFVDGTILFYSTIIVLIPLFFMWKELFDVPPLWFGWINIWSGYLLFFLLVRGNGLWSMFQSADILFLRTNRTWYNAMLTYGVCSLFFLTFLRTSIIVVIALPLLSYFSSSQPLFFIIVCNFFALSLFQGLWKRWTVLRNRTLRYWCGMILLSLVVYVMVFLYNLGMVSFLLLSVFIGLMLLEMRKEYGYWENEVALSMTVQYSLFVAVMKQSGAHTFSKHKKPLWEKKKNRTFFGKRTPQNVAIESLMKWWIRNSSARKLYLQYLAIVCGGVLFSPWPIALLGGVAGIAIGFVFMTDVAKSFWENSFYQKFCHIPSDKLKIDQRIWLGSIVLPIVVCGIWKMVLLFF